MTRTICHVISGLGTGGAERALWRLLANGLQGVCDNHVVCLAAEGPLSEPIRITGVPVHTLGIRSPAEAARGLAQLRTLLKRIGPDVVQGWMYHGNFAASAARVMSGAGFPVAWNIRQSLDDLSGDKLSTRMLIRAGAALSRRPDAIVYNSSRSAREHEAFGYASARTVIIPNGFETGAVSPDHAAGAKERSALGIDRASFLFVHLARWHLMKDHAGFLSAAKLCAEACPHAVFFLAGRGVDNHATAIVADFPAQIRDRIIVRGEIANSLDVLQAADALVVSSSRAEGFPNVLGEAMMTGTACITTDVGESALVVSDGGIVVPPRSPRDLADAMTALARDRNLTCELGRRGRARAAREYDIGPIVTRYCDLYEQLAAAKGG